MRRRIYSLILLLTLFFFGSIQAQEKIDNPFPSFTIKIDDAKKRNYRYLGDLLFLIPGLWVRDMSDVGQWSSFRIGGSNQKHGILLLDGRPLRDPWSGMHDLNLIPVEIIERVEFYPSLNPFGYTAIGGVVNIISKGIPSNRPYTKIVYRSGKNSFSDIDVTFGQKFSSKWEIISGVLLKKYGGNLPRENFTGQKIRSKITYRLFSNMELQYHILYNKSDLDLPYSFPIPGDTLTLSSPHRKRIRYDHTLQTKWNIWGTQNRLRIEHTSLSYEIREQNFNPQKTFPVQTTFVSFLQHVRTGNFPLSWGIQTRFRQVHDPDTTRYKDSITKSFVQVQYMPKQNVRTILQAHAHLSPDGKLRPFFAGQISWQPLQNLNVWASYMESVRDPSLGERFGIPYYPAIPVTRNQLTMRSLSGQIHSASSLKPETGRMGAVGVRHQWSDRLQTSIRAYLKNAENLIEGTLTQGAYRFTNRAQAWFCGLESQIHIGPWYGLKAALIFNLLKATDANGEDLLERPNLWGNGAVSWEHSFFQDDLHVHLCLAGRYWTGFWRLTGETPNESILQESNPGFILDFKASLTIIKNASFIFAIDNVLGTEIYLLSEFPLPQRWTRIGISWELFD